MPFRHNIRNHESLEPPEREVAQLVGHLLDELASADKSLEDQNHSTACTIVVQLYEQLIDSATTQLGYDIGLVQDGS